MEYKYLKTRGALREAGSGREFDADAYVADWGRRGGTRSGRGDGAIIADLSGRRISPEAIELLPESVAREYTVIPLGIEGELVTVAVADPQDIALADKLRFLLARDVQLVGASRQDILTAINRHYGAAECQSVDSLVAEFFDQEQDASSAHRRTYGTASPAMHGEHAQPQRLLEFKKGARGETTTERRRGRPGLDTTRSKKGGGMLFYTVEDGQRVLRVRPNGTVEVVVGPRRVFRGWSRFEPMEHYVAHPGEFLIVRFRAGHQEHQAGPAEIWLDPRVHREITVEDSLQIGLKEAIVV